MKIPSLDSIVAQTKNCFLRFPLVMIDIVVGTIAALMLVNMSDPQPYVYKLLMTTVLALPLLTALKLWSERRACPPFRTWLLQGLGVLFLVFYYFLLPYNLDYAPEYHFIRFGLFTIGFVLAIFFAPFLIKNELNGFWQYNGRLLARFALSFVFTATLYIGLVIAMISVDELLNIDIDEDNYLNLWIVIVGLITTTIFLTGIPQDFKKLNKERFYPTTIKFFAQYILTPLLIVYAVILYIYTAQIFINNDWPEGMVSYLILFFAATGIIANVFLYPLREKWSIMFSKAFYVILLPLVGVLFWSAKIRITEYGLTENRYFLLALGAWLAAISIYFVFSKKQNIKLIPISLFAIVLLSSFGPWGAFSVAENNQLGRLEKLLTENNILVNNQIQKVPEKTVSREEQYHISSIVSYLNRYHGTESMQQWFVEDLSKLGDNDRWYDKNELIMELMGLDYVSYWELNRNDGEYFSLQIDEQAELDITGYDSLMRINAYERMSEETRIENNMLIIVGEDYQIDLDLNSLLKNIKIDRYKEVSPDELTLEQENDFFKTKIYLEHISGSKKNGKYQIENLNGLFLFVVD